MGFFFFGLGCVSMVQWFNSIREVPLTAIETDPEYTSYGLGVLDRLQRRATGG
jgi:hypothetical protein